MDNTIFFVDDEPYCLWEAGLAEQSRRFLASFDTEYFGYVLDTHLKAGDEQRAAMSLRVAYHHSIETLFSFLGAMAQAPNAPHAWLAKCSNAQLRNIVRRISKNDKTLRIGLSLKAVSWTEIARASLHWYKPGAQRQTDSIDLFGIFWGKLASEYLDTNRVDEYNSLKHGFRVSSGGFGLRFGTEHEYGVPPPDHEMHTIEKSEFGTSYRRILTASDRKGDRSLVTQQVSINWKIEKIAPLIQLTSMSIGNVIGALRILNGDPAKDIKFTRPEQDESFNAPWNQAPSANNMTMRIGIDRDLPYLKKEDLLNQVNK